LPIKSWSNESPKRSNARKATTAENTATATTKANVASDGPRRGSAESAAACGGTDGTDGPTDDAGGLVDGGTLQRAVLAGFDAGTALAAADAGSVLAASGDLLHTGPTGTNVMDLVFGLKL